MFEADTPQGVLSQIQSAEPVAPHRVRKGVPRDLETIILKCLAKEPVRRYATAQALADDLRNFANGQPILARRPGLIERAARWARRRRRSALLMAIPSVASVVLMAAALLGHYQYQKSREGSLLLPPDSSPVRGELLDARGDVVARFGVPTVEPVTVAEGTYRLRLTTDGQPSETYHTLVNRHIPCQADWVIGDRRLWGPLTLQPSEFLEVVNLAGRSDLIMATEHGLRRLDGTTGKAIWDVRLDAKEQPALARDPQFRWGAFKQFRPLLVRPAPDLDGDHTGDLVWAGTNAAALLAVSGKTGQVLWAFQSRYRPITQHGVVRATVYGQPLVADVDQDGTPDVIATFVHHEAFGDFRQWLWMEAVSGRTGESLWRCPLGELQEEPTWISRWTIGQDSGWTKASAFQITRSGGKPIATVLAGNHLATVDLSNGQLVRPVCKLGFWPVGNPRFLNAHGPALLLLRQVSGQGPGPLTAVAVSLPAGNILWEKPLGNWGESYAFTNPSGVDWPLVAPLDAEGAESVIVPFAENGQLGVEVLHADGRSRWRRLLGKDTGPELEKIQLAVGPDLDGDSHREVFVATVSQTATRPGVAGVFVDALSGQDGRTLWWWRARQEPLGFLDHLGPLRWWQTESDGMPQLVVPSVDRANPFKSGSTHILSTGTGTLAHYLPGITDPQVADLDGDGIPDLYAVRNQDSRGWGGVFTAFRGSPPEVWRWLQSWSPAPDYNGDGVGELVRWRGGNTACISGADGRVSWQVEVNTNDVLTPPLPHGDLDGDGIPNVLRYGLGGSGSPLYAVSGKTGKVLWTADFRTASEQAKNTFVRFRFVSAYDLQGDGHPDVIAVFDRDVRDFGASHYQREAVVLSGRSGAAKWRQPLSGEEDQFLLTFDKAAGTGIGRLGPNQEPGLLTWAITPQKQRELRAYAGKDGRLLWARPFPEPSPNGPAPQLPLLAAVGDLDGESDVAVLEDVRDPQTARTQCRVWALKGGDGEVKWTASVQGPQREVRLVDLAGGQRGLAVVTQPDNEANQAPLTILDARGRVHQTGRIDLPQGLGATLPLYSTDLDGAGRRGLVRISAGTLWVTRDGIGEVLWQWPLPDGSGEILSILPAQRPAGATVAVWAGGAVFGLDGRTGREVWRCDGPHPADGREVRAALLAASNPGERPRVVFHVSKKSDHASYVTICRLPLATDANGVCLPPPAVTRVYGPPPDDPRFVRPLPWSPATLPTGTELLLLGLGTVPGLLLTLAGWRRSWRLALAALLYGGTAVAIGQSFDVLHGGPHQPRDLLLVQAALALWSIPAFWSLGLLGVWLRQGYWWRVGLWLILAVLAALAIAADRLWYDSRNLMPGEYYSRHDWYLVLPLGAYAAACLLCLARVLRAAIRLARRGLRWTVARARPARSV